MLGAAFVEKTELVEPGVGTPLAQELVLQKKSKIISASAAPPKPEQQATVALGADHGGYALKETLKAYLGEIGFGLLDLGTNSGESVDYPDFAAKVWPGPR